MASESVRSMYLVYGCTTKVITILTHTYCSDELLTFFAASCYFLISFSLLLISYIKRKTTAAAYKHIINVPVFSVINMHSVLHVYVVSYTSHEL